MLIDILDDVCFNCSLVGRDMSESECYDVQMVRTNLIKESVLDFVLNKKRADEVCIDCAFNQLNNSFIENKNILAS